MGISERLQEERKRLGFNQADFAALAGATRKTLFNWESGAASPNAATLAVWADAGLDVLYVVTGQRAGAATAAPVAAVLTPRQAALLDNYAHTDEQGKKIIEAAAFAAAKPSKHKAA